MKKTYYVSITETLNKMVAVEAENFEEAYTLVEEAANSGEVTLTADDFVDRDFADETEETEEMIKDGIIDAGHYQKISRRRGGRKMLYLKKNGLVETACGTIFSFAEELVELILPILEYDINVCFNDRYFTVNKNDTVESIVSKWNKTY